MSRRLSLALACSVAFALPIAGGCQKGAGATMGSPASSEADKALVKAAIKKDLAGIKKALADGANPNASSKVLGDGPSIVPLAREKPAYIQALLDKGADPNSARKDGDSPLITAAIVGNLDVVKLLLDKGANPDHQNGAGYTALSEAVHQGDVAVVTLLLDKGAKPTIGGGKDGGRIPFDRALGKSEPYRDVDKSRVELVQLLLAKAKPDQQRLDMAATASAKWMMAGPNICAVTKALADAGAESTEDVKRFLEFCATGGGKVPWMPKAPPLPPPGAASQPAGGAASQPAR
jgi:hypothetical protein